MTKHLLVADYREKGSRFAALLVRLGLEPAYTNLSVGDYVLSNSVAIERKTPEDLVASILDGRFTDQLRRLSEAYPKGVLLVTGSLEEAAARSPNPGLVYSSLAQACLSSVSLVVSGSEESAAHIVKWLAAEAKNSWTGYEPMIKRKPKDQSTQQQAFNVLTAIPSVGPKRALKLMEAFPSLQAIFEAPEARLAQIVGPSVARNIKSALSRPLRVDRASQARLTDYFGPQTHNQR